jgi:predicted metal-binding membrane protein
VLAFWGLAIALTASGRSDLVSHDAIFERERLPLPAAVVAFALVWQLMTGAMMLPTALPVIAVFGRLAAAQPRPRAAVAAFHAAYFVVWTGFALGALAGDSAIHWLVGHWGWLDERPWLVTGALLVGAGLFQLTPLKERCLTECRNPLQFVWSRYRPGVRAAWNVGIAHGLFCLGCCAALMLVMFGLGVGSVAVMAALTGVMVLEKTWSQGARLVPFVSVAMIALGILAVLAHAMITGLPVLP